MVQPLTALWAELDFVTLVVVLQFAYVGGTAFGVANAVDEQTGFFAPPSISYLFRMESII